MCAQYANARLEMCNILYQRQTPDIKQKPETVLYLVAVSCKFTTSYQKAQDYSSSGQLLPRAGTSGVASWLLFPKTKYITCASAASILQALKTAEAAQCKCEHLNTNSLATGRKLSFQNPELDCI